MSTVSASDGIGGSVIMIASMHLHVTKMICGIIPLRRA